MRNQLIYAAVFALVVVLIIWLAMRPGPEEMPRAATAGREVRLLEEAKAEPADAGTGAVAVTNERQASEWLPASNLVVRARVEGPWVANELIIRLAPHASERVVSEALSGKGFVILRRAGPLGLMRVKVPEGRTLEEAEAMVREMEGISGTERNLRTELPKDVGELPLLDTGMPLTPVGEHGREMLGLDNPAAEAHYGRNCIVALLDTGIDATHPDLMHCVLGG
ncbi:MAG: hypothetical protein N2595_03225, partial [bacterium]|nr:hypothetical protein [bacterium]